jgi:hypothetical protein
MKRFIDIAATIRRQYYNAFLHSLGQELTVRSVDSGVNELPLLVRPDI